MRPSEKARLRAIRPLSDAVAVDQTVREYRRQHGGYPMRVPLADCDYSSDGTTYTIICPSLLGKFRWDPYVIRDGTFVRWPPYMDDIMKARGLGTRRPG